jgi:acetolactate synthase I/II/III large subunit
VTESALTFIPDRPRLGGDSQTVADTVVATLDKCGVKVAIGLDDPRGFFAALRRSPIRTVIVHDERSGGFMADGYGRAAGVPAVCSGNSGPGASNLVPGLLEAYYASTPVVAVLGEHRADRPGGHVFQEADHRTLLAGVVKAIVDPATAEQAALSTAHAVALATAPRSRPSLLLLNEQLFWSPAASNGDGGPAPVDMAAPAADPRAVERAVELLAAARKPVIFAGNGVLLADGGAALQAFAEAMHIPVATSPLGKGVIAETHPLALGVVSSYTAASFGLGHRGLDALTEADVVLAVGTDLDPISTVEGRWPAAGASLIRVDTDPHEFLSHDSLNLLGDAAVVLEQMTLVAQSARAGDPPYVDWVDALTRSIGEDRQRVSDADLSRSGEHTVWPGAIVRELAEHLVEGDAIVADASYASAWAVDRVVQRWPGRLVFSPRASGMLGWGLPAAMGVKLARPDANVVALVGDGAFMFCIGEMETAVREQLPVTLVLLNNGVYGSQRNSNRLSQGEDYDDLWFGRETDYVALARAVGWWAERATSEADFSRAYREALSSKRPCLIDVAVDPNVRAPFTKFE